MQFNGRVRPAKALPVLNLTGKHPGQGQRRDLFHRIGRGNYRHHRIKRQHPAAIGAGQIAQPQLAGIYPLLAAHFPQGHHHIGLIRQKIGKAFVGIGRPEIKSRSQFAIILTRKQKRKSPAFPVFAVDRIALPRREGFDQRRHQHRPHGRRAREPHLGHEIFKVGATRPGA